MTQKKSDKKEPEKLVLINPTKLTEEQKEKLKEFLEAIDYEESISAHSAATS
ncbi:hypothetical protein [Acinetobacter venetianus]|uniref:Uncharacterized protein n=1 Tax=Acinetobacter venetianus TaxID=52133 RepID=A0A150HWL6_9GAMM|nr:hypothetical protein [Acinetobacter venetianus]KXZ71493.1 hypothetical protein AVENLUH13518_01068 [Acinetobacter venetianus]